MESKKFMNFILGFYFILGILFLINIRILFSSLSDVLLLKFS